MIQYNNSLFRDLIFYFKQGRINSTQFGERLIYKMKSRLYIIVRIICNEPSIRK